MLRKIKNIISNTDRFLFRKFGSDKSVKLLENLKEARIIFSHLDKIGEQSSVRFVGGCVRKALCGEEVDDIDLATSLEPNAVKKELGGENIKVIDTGISHGTVTAILNKKKFEITTLRKDIFTDGRHANVEFTSNWEEDASRRDFTLNAIYADIEGRIFDPLNGVSDLKNGNVKFIGSPIERIQEDYLRILRYLRFFTQYSKKNHNEDVIDVVKQNINGLNKISNERIFDELKKILLLNNVYDLFICDATREIILKIFPQFKYYKRLEKLNIIGSRFRNFYDIYLTLALLIVDQSNDYEYFCYKYKVSNNVRSRLKNISENFENLKNKKFFSKENLKKLIYFTNKNHVIDILLFSNFAIDKKKDFNIEHLINFVRNCEIPKFPISGNLLKKHGYESGHALGKKLKFLEQKWIDNNFVIDEAAIEKSLKNKK